MNILVFASGVFRTSEVELTQDRKLGQNCATYDDLFPLNFDSKIAMR